VIFVGINNAIISMAMCISGICRITKAESIFCKKDIEDYSLTSQIKIIESNTSIELGGYEKSLC